MYIINVFNKDFDEFTIEASWKRATIVAGFDPNVIRKDICGSWIKKFDYGNAFSDYGWEIDNIKPKSKAGSDNLSNLQPLHSNNNRAKGNKWPESRTVR